MGSPPHGWGGRPKTPETGDKKNENSTVSLARPRLGRGARARHSAPAPWAARPPRLRSLKKKNLPLYLQILLDFFQTPAHKSFPQPNSNLLKTLISDTYLIINTLLPSCTLISIIYTQPTSLYTQTLSISPNFYQA